MKILIYTHFYPPEVGAAPTRIKYFVQVLRTKGFDVKIIAPKPSYPIGKFYQGFQDKFIIKNEAEDITYLPIFFVNSHSPFGRLFSYLSYFFSSFFYLLFFRYKPDVVISSSPPIFTSLAALIYSKIKKSKFIFDVRDVWPDIGIQLGILKHKLFINGLTKLEKFILNNSDKIIVTANGDKENIERKVNQLNKCEVIFNGADTEVFKLLSIEEKQAVRDKFNIPRDKIVLVYFGSFNLGMNDIDILGDFLICDKINNKDIFFLSIGSGNKLNDFIKKINKKNNYKSINSLKLEDVAQLVAASDVSIIPRKSIQKDTGGNIPVKCFESWAAGVPVLLSNIEDAEISKIFNYCNAGVLVKPNNLDELVNGFEFIINNDFSETNFNAANFVKDNFDRKRQAEKLINIIKDIS